MDVWRLKTVHRAWYSIGRHMSNVDVYQTVDDYDDEYKPNLIP